MSLLFLRSLTTLAGYRPKAAALLRGDIFIGQALFSFVQGCDVIFGHDCHDRDDATASSSCCAVIGLDPDTQPTAARPPVG